MKEKSRINEINQTLWGIDLCYNEIYGHTSGYILKDRVTAIIETGTNGAVPIILDALDVLAIDRSQVRYVIGTHVHLDHAGGSGQLLANLPEARMIVHPSGAKHLINPEKLIKSARGVYGKRYDQLFGEIHPVPEEKVMQFHEGMEISLGDRSISLFYSPGHAFHHIIVHSPVDRGIFSGDAAGLLFPAFRIFGLEFLMLTTTPTQFEPELMKKTITLMKDLHPESIFFTHFGPSSQASILLQRARELVDIYVELGKEAQKEENPSLNLTGKLRNFHQDELTRHGVQADHPALRNLETDFELNSAGILYYLNKLEETKTKLD